MSCINCRTRGVYILCASNFVVVTGNDRHFHYKINHTVSSCACVFSVKVLKGWHQPRASHLSMQLTARQNLVSMQENEDTHDMCMAAL